jgi:hypothetical protein
LILFREIFFQKKENVMKLVKKYNGGWDGERGRGGKQKPLTFEQNSSARVVVRTRAATPRRGPTDDVMCCDMGIKNVPAGAVGTLVVFSILIT